MSSQWQFPLDALRRTPSAITPEEEMLRRQRGIDWLMRVGATLNMCVQPIFSYALNEKPQGIGPLFNCRNVPTQILYATHVGGLP
jgi:hypothetical protein